MSETAGDGQSRTDPRSGEDCAHCGKPIEHPTRAWREISSWVSPVGGKGSTLASSTGRLMHEACIQLRKNGVAAEQESLI